MRSELIIKGAELALKAIEYALENKQAESELLQELNKEARKIENATKFLTNRGFTDLAEAVSGSGQASDKSGRFPARSPRPPCSRRARW